MQAQSAIHLTAFRGIKPAPHLGKIAANQRDTQALDAFVLMGATTVRATGLVLGASTTAWLSWLTSGCLLGALQVGYAHGTAAAGLALVTTAQGVDANVADALQVPLAVVAGQLLGAALRALYTAWLAKVIQTAEGRDISVSQLVVEKLAMAKKVEAVLSKRSNITAALVAHAIGGGLALG